MHSIPDVLSKILQHLEQVHQQKDGSWLARCPAHDDREPSIVREVLRLIAELAQIVGAGGRGR